MKNYESVEVKRLYGRCSQLWHSSTPDTVGLARRYHRQADELNAGFSTEEAVGSVHGGDKIFVCTMKFVSRLSQKCYIDRFFWELKRFRQLGSDFADAPSAVLRRY